MHNRWKKVIGICILLFTVATSAATAEDATPAALPVTPDPSECMIEPRTFESVVALVGTPIATPQSSASPTPFVAPVGEPADPETVAEVTATARELLACYNAFDIGRYYALYTDDAIRFDFYATAPPSEEERPLFEGSNPLPTEARATLRDVRNVTVLPDGRVGAVVVYDDPAFPPDDPQTDYFIFKRVEGRYLVDVQIHDILGPIGTPTP